MIVKLGHSCVDTKDLKCVTRKFKTIDLIYEHTSISLSYDTTNASSEAFDLIVLAMESDNSNK